jgi:flagellar biosynthesis/type III secretory pathway protein FliH
MDEEVKKEEADKDFEEKREEMKKKDEAKTSKNKARRDKAKARKEKAKGKGTADANGDNEAEADGTADGPVKKSLKPMIVSRDDESDGLETGGEVKNADEIGIVFHDED